MSVKAKITNNEASNNFIGDTKQHGEKKSSTDIHICNIAVFVCNS
jgi:hypothetical protein